MRTRRQPPKQHLRQHPKLHAPWHPTVNLEIMRPHCHQHLNSTPISTYTSTPNCTPSTISPITVPSSNLEPPKASSYLEKDQHALFLDPNAFSIPRDRSPCAAHRLRRASRSARRARLGAQESFQRQEPRQAGGLRRVDVRTKPSTVDGCEILLGTT